MVRIKKDKEIKIAILDMYEGTHNQGMRCMLSIIKKWALDNSILLTCKVFDIRQKCKFPSMSYDIFISSGGPGSPITTNELKWDIEYQNWIQSVLDWNKQQQHKKKFVLFICHSFQLACRFFDIGLLCKRRSTRFSIVPIQLIATKKTEPVFYSKLIYVVDSRDYQLICPNIKKMKSLGMNILAFENTKSHHPYQRAVTAIRFNRYMLGVQFHPEADAEGLKYYLQTAEKKQIIFNEYGEGKWHEWMRMLNDETKIHFTHDYFLPSFLNDALLYNN